MSIQLPELNSPQRSLRSGLIATGVALLFVGGYFVFKHESVPAPPVSLQCAQPPLIVPDFAGKNVENSSIFTTSEYESYSMELLQKAVRIPTVTFDDMSFDVTKDARFDIFNDLHEYFADHFPLLTKHVEKVNTYGLLYTIRGTNPDLKPLVLMAHQDVVPVAAETLDEWEHPPFDAVFDGSKIFGRGVSDTKNSLVAIHEAVEALLKQKWRPERTLLLSFGFDEEIQGFRGARKLADVIEERYGSVEMLIDEGAGFTDRYGVYFATPGVAEKGRVNFKFTINTPGGHSSAPPDHTGIGLMAELITMLEEDVPLPATLTEKNVVRGMFSCFGHYGLDLDKDEKELYTNLQSPARSDALAQILAEERLTRILVETTQAIDIVHGGVKVNALPEQVVAEVNYRVKPDSSVEKETKRVVGFVDTLARDFKLGANYTNSFYGEPSKVLMPVRSDSLGFIHVETTDVLDVAPISPYYDDPHWDLISGTTKHVLEHVALHFDRTKSVVMAPALMTGNTDTAHYWNLTSNMYRYRPALTSDSQNVHTVNEALAPRSHFSAVIFFYELLVNMDRDLS